jgi:hypothetical protein
MACYRVKFSLLLSLCAVFTITYLKNIVSNMYSFADILYLQFIVHVMLFPMFGVLYCHIITFRSMFAVLSMAFS